VLWTDIGPAAEILKQMRELGMKQRVFGSHRTIGEELIELAGPAAEGFEAVYPYDPSQRTQKWMDFNRRFDAAYHQKPDHFAALAYDAMQVLLQAICQAGLNRGRIRDALTGVEQYNGVTGHMVFDPNCKNISPMYLGTVHDGSISYRRITMEKPYAKVGEDGVQYTGPPTADNDSAEARIAVFGPGADQAVGSPEVTQLLQRLSKTGQRLSLIAIPSETSWGKASTALVQAVYQQQVVGIIATDRNSSHLAQQIGVKAFVPLLAISSDELLTSTNIPWVFRMPEGTSLQDAIAVLADAVKAAGINRGKVRDLLASGKSIGGVRFESNGQMR
jgi:ABC-type branched-subunit amino acid transport system substrate-binding protein